MNKYTLIRLANDGDSDAYWHHVEADSPEQARKDFEKQWDDGAKEYGGLTWEDSCMSWGPVFEGHVNCLLVGE